jgi:hypothetical protein
MAERQQIPVYQFDHKERKAGVANQIRKKRGVYDDIVFMGCGAGESAGLSGQEDQWAVPVHTRQNRLCEPLLFLY